MISFESMMQEAAQGNVGPALLPLSVYVAMVTIFLAAEQHRAARWPGVPGRIRHESEQGSTGGIQVINGKRLRYWYEYQVDNQWYTGIRAGFWSPFLGWWGSRRIMDAKPGSTVMVYYDPKNPQRSMLSRPDIKDQVFTITAGVAPLLLSVAGVSV